MSCPEFSPGEIVLIRHTPLDDPSAAKARPALVVSSSTFNRGNLDVIIVAISSVVRVGDPKQIVIYETDLCFPQTGLKMTSAVKCGAVFAYPKSQIRRRLGAAPKEILEQVRALLVKFLTDD
jgi:mRNA-degrading endonuclease toxin of MazEF toxin-antitoxin module